MISTESDSVNIVRRKMTASSEFAHRLRWSSESTEDDLMSPTTPSGNKIIIFKAFPELFLIFLSF